MPLRNNFIAAIIAILTCAVPVSVIAQNPDLSQNPVPDHATVPQDQGQSQDQSQVQDQGQNQEQDQDMGSAPNAQSGAPYDQTSPGDQSNRPPMSELPPVPNKPSPNIMGPGPGPTMGGPPPGASGQGSFSQTASNNGVGRLSLIHGDVSTRRGDSGEWSAAQLNAPLMAGDSISTGDKSRVEVQLDYANIYRLAEHTQANITNLTRSKIQIQMGHGMANYTVLRNSDADAEIDTPNVSIRTERHEASFRILVTADDHTEVLVRRGEIEITTPQGGTRVGANQFITIRGNGDETQYRIGEAPSRDDWDQWNTDRDRMINGSVSRSRTNDYYTGSQDLDANGSWRSVPDYGQAWFPNEPQGWVPYSAGTWVWEPYWGWTWVSYEPWGWAPYHYGRWFLYNGAWGWWPGPVYGYPYYRPIWAPAYVSFFGFGPGIGVGFGFGFGFGSIGWFPIGPCDFFHPWWGAWGGRFGYTGFYGWNRGGFAPLHAGERFSNVRLASHDPNFRGATSVAADRFGQGHTAFSPAGHAALQNAHFATGNLPVTPTRASLSASGRAAAPSTTVNRGGSHFFSPSGTGSAASGRSFEHEQAQISNAMRQNGVSPVNGNRGSENGSNSRTAQADSRGTASEAGRSNTEGRGNSDVASTARAGNATSPYAGREGGSSNGSWQKFTPMQPRSSDPGTAGSTGRSNSNGAETRSPGGMENRGGAYGSSRYGSEGRAYGGGGSYRPPLNMRQPIVTPRSYGGSSRGYGGRAPSYGGGHSAPSGHSGGGGSHGGGGGHGGHR